MARDEGLCRYFVAVAEELSFTAASARLNVAQPWLSARIRQLEDRLGVALFVRTTRRVTLTEEGRELLPWAQAVTLAAGQFDQAWRKLRDAPRALHIGMPPYGGKEKSPSWQLLETFRRTHPNSRVEIDVGWTPVLVSKVDAGQLELAFVAAMEAAAQLDTIRLADIVLELEMSANDPLANTPLVAQDLAGRSIVTFVRGPNPPFFDRLYGPLKAAGAHLIEESNPWSMETLREGYGEDVLLAKPTAGQARTPAPGRVFSRVLDIDPAPFTLVRSKGASTAYADAFWAIAKKAERARLAAA